MFAADIDPTTYIKGYFFESSLENFLVNTESGAFLISRDLGQERYSKAILLIRVLEKSSLIDMTRDKEIPISRDLNEAFNKSLDLIEEGTFKQVCFDGPSEGSVSLLVVKNKGRIVLKLVSDQHDYTHLNADERVRLKGAFDLIDLMDRNTPKLSQSGVASK